MHVIPTTIYADLGALSAAGSAVKTLATITTDHMNARFVDSTGNALVWGDSVYMESPSTKKFHVFVNAYSPQLQDESFMYIFDTVDDKVGGPLLYNNKEFVKDTGHRRCSRSAMSPMGALSMSLMYGGWRLPWPGKKIHIDLLQRFTI